MSKSIIRRVIAGAVGVAAVGTVALGAAGPSAHASTAYPQITASKKDAISPCMRFQTTPVEV